MHARLLWRARILALMALEGEARKREESAARSRDRLNRVKSGRGRFQGGR